MRAGEQAEERVAWRAVVRGRVQGVGFRYRTRERASALGLRGWVRNLRDGRVEIRVEGSPSRVESFFEWLAVGPPHARVEGVDREAVEPEGPRSFEISF